MLILSYLNGHNDGFGAQYQRILGIYCICKKYNLLYYHTPLDDIWFQGLHAIENNHNCAEFVNRCNKRINIKSDIDISNIDNLEIIKKYHYKDIFNVSYLLELKKDCDTHNKNIILYLDYPYKITDIIPNIYKYCQNL